MGEEDHLPSSLNDRIDHKRKHEDNDDLTQHDRKLGFSSSVSPAPERIRKTGFSSAPPPPPPPSNDLPPFERKPGVSGSPSGPYDRKTGFSGPPSDSYDRKTGFSGPPSEPYDRKTGFSGPPFDQFERKSGFSGPNDSLHEVKTGFSGLPGGDFQSKSGFSGPNDSTHVMKTGFSGPSGGDFPRKTGFSGPPSGEFERKTGFSGPPGGDPERKTGFSSGDYERKSGFSGPHSGDMDRKTGFSDSGISPGLSDIEVAKQKAAQIVARLVAQDSKRPHGDEDGDDRFSGKFHSSSGGYGREDHDRGQMFQDHSQVHHHNEDRGGNYYNSQGYPQSKKMDIPNGRVGVVIGKGGETIKYLQQQSGAKIQITRDSEHDPSLPNRQVEIMGTAEQINRAEQMVKDVLAEAEAGGPAPFMGSGSSGPAAFGEPIQLRVPTNKVGLIIGRGGDTIRNLQSQSGARIQLVASPMADYGEERVLTLVGSKQQTDLATELIKEVISENRSRGPPGGYNQGFRPPGPPQWGPPRAQQGSFSGPQSQPFNAYGQQPPPQPYGGGYSHQSQPSSSQQNPPQTQPSYGAHGQQSSSQEYSGQPQYGGFPQRAPAPSPSQQTTSQGYYNQPPVTSPSGTNSGFNQHQGGYGVQAPYGQQQQQGYGQPPPMTQSPGQPTTQQPYTNVYGQPQQSYTQGYGQPSSGYTHQSFAAPSVPQSQSSTEQGAISAPTGYGAPGSVPNQEAAKQPGFNQYGQTSQQVGYGQHQLTSYNQQESAPTYGQGGSFQPGYPPQEDSTGSGGSSQGGYGQLQSGYNTQGYGTQGSLPTNYGQPSSYGQQPSSYGASQPGSSALYGSQGPIQPPPNYAIQGSIPPPQSGYAHPTSAQQGYGNSTSYGNTYDDHSQGTAQHVYNQGEGKGGVSTGGLDSSNVSVASGVVSSTTEG